MKHAAHACMDSPKASIKNATTCILVDTLCFASQWQLGQISALFSSLLGVLSLGLVEGSGAVLPEMLDEMLDLDGVHDHTEICSSGSLALQENLDVVVAGLDGNIVSGSGSLLPFLGLL